MTNQEYYRNLRKNNGEPPHEVDEDRFMYLLEVLPPAKWTRRKDSESFMVIECETANLFTWCARIGDKYYEMIAPNDCTHWDILQSIAIRLARIEELQNLIENEGCEEQAAIYLAELNGK